MSASLVGSEMCIRDRSWPVVAQRWPLRACLLRRRGGMAERQVFGSQPGTVSYTHLTLPTICSV
eukprot:1871271-Alexandrium_andersonii.AAC.1